jgi:uncharacterized membrane protein YeaQ/YmgE (transglycosylase-associated protein family)
MEILLWILFGALAGWIASMIMGVNARQGLVGDVLLGVVGAVIGGFLLNLLGTQGVTGFNVYSLIVAIFGAIALIGVSRAVLR